MGSMSFKKSDWFFILTPLFVTWAIDRITKLWALNIEGFSFTGPVGFVKHFNHGAMLGLFSDLPQILRVVSLSTGGAFLIFIFIVIQYLLPIKSMMLRAGMSVLLGGILGNVTDRIVWGYVVDFILLGSLESHSPAFNLADALQWVGYAMIVVALIREGDILWPAHNVRKKIWINPKFQLRYSLILTSFGLALFLIAGVYSYTFLRVTIIELVGKNSRILEQFLLPFTLTFIVVSLGFSLVLFLLGRVLSHRIAGPLYAFEKFLDDAVDGNLRPLKLRAGDDFKHLEELAERIQQIFESYQIAADIARAKQEGSYSQLATPPDYESEWSDEQTAQIQDPFADGDPLDKEVTQIIKEDRDGD